MKISDKVIVKDSESIYYEQEGYITSLDFSAEQDMQFVSVRFNAIKEEYFVAKDIEVTSELSEAEWTEIKENWSEQMKFISQEVNKRMQEKKKSS